MVKEMPVEGPDFGSASVFPVSILVGLGSLVWVVGEGVLGVASVFPVSIPKHNHPPLKSIFLEGLL